MEVFDMEVFTAIKNRRSIRSYSEKPIEKQKLMKVLEAVRLSPSAGNRQPWRFIVITDPKVKERLRESYNRDWFISAPVIIVACALPKEAWVRSDGEEYWKVDVAIAMQDLVLVAWEEGLGSCWIAAFNEKEARRALGIQKNVRVVAMTPLGYPAESKEPVSNRKSLEEIIRYDSI
jgi:nitroreductase